MTTDPAIPSAMTEAIMLSVSQVAEALGLKPATIRAWIAQRKLGHVKLGRAVRVPRTEVERLLREGAVPAKERADGRGR